MDNLLFIDACVRQSDSRTLRIAEPIIEALKPRFKHFFRYNLPEMDCIGPLTPSSFAARGEGDIPEWATEAATRIRQASAIVIAAPFWDMSFPAVLKCFFEQVSLFDITFTDNGETCVGLCEQAPVIYITTRGMDIHTGDPREHLHRSGALAKSPPSQHQIWITVLNPSLMPRLMMPLRKASRQSTNSFHWNEEIHHRVTYLRHNILYWPPNLRCQTWTPVQISWILPVILHYLWFVVLLDYDDNPKTDKQEIRQVNSLPQMTLTVRFFSILPL